MSFAIKMHQTTKNALNIMHIYTFFKFSFHSNIIYKNNAILWLNIRNSFGIYVND